MRHGYMPNYFAGVFFSDKDKDLLLSFQGIPNINISIIPCSIITIFIIGTPVNISNYPDTVLMLQVYYISVHPDYGVCSLYHGILMEMFC